MRSRSSTGALTGALGLVLIAGCSGELKDNPPDEDLQQYFTGAPTAGQGAQAGSATAGAAGLGAAGSFAATAGAMDMGQGAGTAQAGGEAGLDAPPQAAPVCGDGQREGAETCDPPGSCPTACEAPDACMTGSLIGSAATCDAACVYAPIAVCEAGDGCCAEGCNANNDSDCDPICGNGAVEEGEVCDPIEDCPTTCDDADPCTEDSAIGQAADCTASCEHVAIAGCNKNHARGAHIDSVSLDQAVRIVIAEQGAAIAPEDRRAQIVARRPGMLRAFPALDTDFQPRQLRAVLTLSDTGEMLESVAQVDAMSTDYGQIDDGFVWQLSAEQITPGVEYSIELFEADESRDGDPLPMPAPIFPAEGSVPLGVDETYMKMRVVLVPLEHALGAGCPPAPDLHAAFGDGTEAQYIAQRLYAMNPVDEVEVVVHDPVPYTGTAQDSGPIFTVLRQLRQEDSADPGWYYFGLIDPCDGGPNFSGVASVGSPTRGAAGTRAGWGVYRDRGRSAFVVVHELGHEQGRLHVGCSGQEASPDPAYPNNTGDTDSWGFDLFSEELYDPGRHDYMSYCNDTWVSEYGWNFSFPRIETISSWELELNTSELVEVLHVMVYADGSTESWIGREYYDPPDETEQIAAHRIEFYQDGQRLAEQPARYEAIPESTGYELTTALPASFGRASHVAFVDGLMTRAIAASRIKRVKRRR